MIYADYDAATLPGIGWEWKRKICYGTKLSIINMFVMEENVFVWHLNDITTVLVDF